MVVKLTINHPFRHNDISENLCDSREISARLRPRLWPILFNICGYLLPVVLILHRRLLPLRYANYIYIFPLWFAVMTYTGVILETRVFGEHCPYIAVATVLLLEQHSDPLLHESKSTSDQPVSLALF